MIAVVGGYAAAQATDNEQWNVPSADHRQKFMNLYKVSKTKHPAGRLQAKNKQDWAPTVRALIETAPSVRSYPGHSGRIARQWVFNSRIVLTGDAAHPIGHAGFGAGMAIDDALALFMALERIQLSSETKGTILENALNLFQSVRKPHADRLGDFLARTGKAKSIYGKHLSEEQILEWVNGRENTAWIHEHDINVAFGLADTLSL